MIPVEEIPFGQYFRKRKGAFAYLRISDNSARFLGLLHRDYVYGVAYNGNVTKVERGTLVHPTDASVMAMNRVMEERFNEQFCQ